MQRREFLISKWRKDAMCAHLEKEDMKDSISKGKWRYGATRILRMAILCLIGVCGLWACEKPEILLNKPNENFRTLAGFIENNFDYTLFSAALEYTGLLDTLANDEGEYTLLAPSNSAFEALGINRVTDFNGMDRDSLRSAMAYHIIPYRLHLDDVPMDQMNVRYETLADSALYAHRYLFRNDYNFTGLAPRTEQAIMVTFSGAEVNNAISMNNLQASLSNQGDISLSNGLLHPISKVIKLYSTQTVQEWLSNHPNYSIFVAGLKRFGLWDELAGTGPFTLFAPTNSALEEGGITEDWLAGIDVNDYIGARLFGAYIMYGRKLFIRDSEFYIASRNQFWFSEKLRNDDEYYRMFMGQTMFNSYTINGIYQPNFNHRFTTSQGEFWTYDFTVGIAKVDMPYRYFTPNQQVDNHARFLGGGWAGNEDYFCGGEDKNQNDHLCTNGIVHTIHRILVHYNEALIDN